MKVTVKQSFTFNHTWEKYSEKSHKKVALVKAHFLKKIQRVHLKYWYLQTGTSPEHDESEFDRSGEESVTFYGVLQGQLGVVGLCVRFAESKGFNLGSHFHLAKWAFHNRIMDRNCPKNRREYNSIGKKYCAQKEIKNFIRVSE